MLSILIPVYNIDVHPLAIELLSLSEKAGLPVEIRIYEDASRLEFSQPNASLASIPGVVYCYLSENMGRAKIRNLLAKEAVYDYLLFLDADSAVESVSFLDAYLSLRKANAVIYGGRTYAVRAPVDSVFLLHWRVGTRRECAPASLRRQKPYLSFMSNNFMVHRALFDEIGFDESIHNYGHEDTVFGLRLKQMGIPLIHIDNPLEHTGLEPASVFLEKTRLAAENLYDLKQRYPELNTPLLSWFNRLGSLSGLLRLLATLQKPLRLALLSFPQIPLIFFDLYKLSCLSKKARFQARS